MDLNQFSTVDIVLDKANDNIIQRQTISAGDRDGRSLTLQVTNEGSIGEVPGLTANLLWTNHSSGLSDLSAFSVVDRTTSIFKIEYPQNMLTAGKVTAQIQLLYGGKVTHSKKFEIIVLDVAGSLKGVLQTAEYSALVTTLAKANEFEIEIAKKANTSYVDTALSTIAKGGPREFFYSTQALWSKYPTGAEGTYLVFDTAFSDGAHAFMWKDNNWVDLGVYQAQAISNSELKRIATDRYTASRIAEKGSNVFQNSLLIDELEHFTPNNSNTNLSVVTSDKAKWLKVMGQTGVGGNGVYQIFREWNLVDNKSIEFDLQLKNFNDDVLVIQIGYLFGSDTATFSSHKNMRFKLPTDGTNQKIKFTEPLLSPYELQYDRLKISVFYETDTGATPIFYIRKFKAKLVETKSNSLPYNLMDKIKVSLNSDEQLKLKYDDSFIRPINDTEGTYMGAIIPRDIVEPNSLKNKRLKLKGEYLSSSELTNGYFFLRALNSNRELVTVIRLFTVKGTSPGVRQSFEQVVYRDLSTLTEQHVYEFQLCFAYDNNDVVSNQYIDIYDLELETVPLSNVLSTSYTNKTLLPQINTQVVTYAYQKQIGRQNALTFDADIRDTALGRQGFITDIISKSVLSEEMMDGTTIFECEIHSKNNLFVDVVLSLQMVDGLYSETRLANYHLDNGERKRLFINYNLRDIVRRANGDFKNLVIMVVNSSQVGLEQKSFDLLNWDWRVENVDDVVPFSYNGIKLEGLPTVNLIGDPTDISNEVPVRFIYKSDSLDINAYAKLGYQGSSSLAYDKKNYKIKLYSDENVKNKMPIQMTKKWEATNRYNLKANWIDITHARNIVAANLVKEMYQSNPKVPDRLLKTSAIGQIDGYPVNVFLNNQYRGLYTLNLGKKDEMMGMVDEDLHVLISGEEQAPATWFKVNESTITGEDWIMEFPDDPTAEITTSFNRVLTFVNSSTDEDFVANLGDYINKEMLFDYMVAVASMTLADQYGKNQMFATWDKNVWTPILYDLDTSFGNSFDGTSVVEPNTPLTDYRFFKDNKLYKRTYDLFQPELRSRYEELRKTVFTEQNMIDKFERFIDSVGVENYESDLRRWPTIPNQYITSTRKIREHIIKRLRYLDNYFAK